MIAPPEWVVEAGLGEAFYGGLCLGTLAVSYAVGYLLQRHDARRNRGETR